jgi:hypothetical protein
MTAMVAVTPGSPMTNETSMTSGMTMDGWAWPAGGYQPPAGPARPRRRPVVLIVTAVVAAAARITGKVTSIAGIAVGDLVSATITGTDGKLTAGTIQDPASLP